MASVLPQHARFFDEPGLVLDEHGQWSDKSKVELSDRDYVHAMWENSENEDTTDPWEWENLGGCEDKEAKPFVYPRRRHACRGESCNYCHYNSYYNAYSRRYRRR